MSPDLTSRSAVSSKTRISRILRYSSAGVCSSSVIARSARSRSPQHGAELGVGVVRGALAGLAQQHVVVVGEQAAVRFVIGPPGILPVLQVQRDRPARPAAEVVAAAVVEPAVVETHVTLWND